MNIITVRSPPRAAVTYRSPVRLYAAYIHLCIDTRIYTHSFIRQVCGPKIHIRRYLISQAHDSGQLYILISISSGETEGDVEAGSGGLQGDRDSSEAQEGLRWVQPCAPLSPRVSLCILFQKQV